MFRELIVTGVLAAAISLTAPPVQAATFQTLYNFTGGADGSFPDGRMVFNTNTGMLYGTTVQGGSGSGGTVFQFDPASHVLTTLYSFTLGSSAGSSPQTPLILGKKGVLFGVATTGGGSSNKCAYGCGTIFRLDPATKILKTLYRFTDQSDGGTPEGRLEFYAAKSTVFGTTVQGGDFADCQGGCGTVFKFVLAGKVFSTLHAFRSIPDDGGKSVSGMVLDSSGILYGAVSGGGAHGSGIVFRLDSATNAYSVLHSFDYHVDGTAGPDLLLSGGLLYGTTLGGGPTANGYGTIFSMDPATGATTTLYSFADGTDGIFPSGGLVTGPKSSLYGTAAQGTSLGTGAAFALNPTTLKFTVLHDFAGNAEGSLPQTGVVRGPAGVLYGVTSYGNGTIFEITP